MSPRMSKKKEQELQKRLFLTITAIIATIGLVYYSIKYFGPRIGSIFGLISVNRNDSGSSDTIAPPPPEFSYIPSAANSPQITLNGISEPGVVVHLFVNGPETDTTTADSEGLFTFPNIPLKEGNNTIFARSTDQNNNESEKSETLAIMLDTKKPEIKIDTPKNGETVRNLNDRVEVTGQLNERSTVHVNDRLAVTKPDNTFEILLGVEEGDVQIKVEAQDEAGNIAEETIYIKYLKQ